MTGGDQTVLARGTGSAVAVHLTAWAVHLPGADPAPPGLPEALKEAVQPAVSAEEAARVLGRKGLLFKEPATRLALCAVHAALGLAPGVRPKAPVLPDVAVVACSNLGNVATVAEVARTVRAGSVRDVSPLAAPNASSNVVASTVALWFGLGGPNFMVCSGAVAGWDGLDIAVRLLRTRRASQVVLVGAEPDDETARGLRGTALTAGAAAVILERPVAAAGPVPPVDLTLGPGGFDPAAAWGDLYGGQGVLGLALARAAISGGCASVAAGGADDRDGGRTTHIWADTP
ncbi:beta-ketoacyl synthase N-terminal-like domain-containing protein [Plantactinospora sp. WMMC1484]|uniref:beta-ketoacyl synthase N-terminal-like domain-containing protein n=1 Tax=Plantactinospora sp. WMMC1484 TaxID=3404122 RepID=UPI003BF525AE